MTRSSLPLEWIGTGIPDFRDCYGTYCATPLQELPKVQGGDDLTWVTPLTSDLDAEMRQYRPTADQRRTYARNAKAILAQSEQLGVRLPRVFVELIQSEALQDRFPSNAACYFDLPEKIAPAPLGLDGHIIRFLNDSQGCVMWYLHLPGGEAESVLAASPVYYSNDSGEEDVVYFLEDLEGHDHKLMLEAAASTRIVSTSLSEFLYRYWLENHIWFKRSRGVDLTTEEAAYLEGAKSM